MKTVIYLSIVLVDVWVASYAIHLYVNTWAVFPILITSFSVPFVIAIKELP